jgi:hypothetical protein
MDKKIRSAFHPEVIVVIKEPLSETALKHRRRRDGKTAKAKEGNKEKRKMVNKEKRDQISRNKNGKEN